MASTAVVFDILAKDRASDKFDHLGRSVGNSSGVLSKFAGVAKAAGKVAILGLASGVGLAAVAGAKFAKAAVEDAQSAELLRGALERNAGATKGQVADVEDWITAIGKAKGVADDDLRPALARLVTATHDVGKAQVLAQVAMDVSAGTGKSLEAVSTALMKAQNGQVSSLSRLGINTKNAAGETISMEEAVSRMSDTFGGAASEKAQTLQGKMDRLKLMLSETGEAIGYKLIPVVLSMASFFLNNVVPALSKTSDWLGVNLMPKIRQLGHWISDEVVPAVKTFVGQMKSGEGAGGQFASALGKLRAGLENVWGVLKPVITFMANNKTVVATFAGVILTVVTAVKAWAIAQGILNVVLTANPIGLVVVAVAALAAGLVYAWKKSETFRTGVKKAWEVLKVFIGFTPLGALILNFNQVRDAVEAVVGKVQALVSWIGKLDLGKLKGVAGAIPGLGGLFGRGKGGGNSVDVGNPGAALIESIVKGIDKGKVKLGTVLDKLKDFIQKHQDRLADLLSQRGAMVDAFKGFASSIFSTDLSVGEGEAPKGIAALLAFQKQQRAKAEQLKGDVQSLIGKGISKDLLTQLQNAGEAGEEQIHLLASGTVDEIRQANEDNAATLQALQDAGLAAAKAQGLEAQIKAEENAIKLADTIKGKLQELLDEQDKNTVVELYLDGHKILWSLKKIKKQNGGHLGLGDKDPD